MPELSPQERLQPALLDRLSDDEPTNQRPEPRERRIINAARLRQAVLRDLAWLFNSTNLASADVLASYPHAEKSVINYGLPVLAGQTASQLDLTALESAMRQAIIDFEPRIVPSTLQVEAIITGQALDHHNVVSVQIMGQLWNQPVPLELLLRTEVDLETGTVEIRDLGKSGRA
ncbi:MAG TPA: type VI secretion system baseplate subunit TssE [Steroidobacteraceae bacterium]|nr:type VI secretion system baseplate subunit TssE [Steroidobacteraceae bacterium]